VFVVVFVFVDFGVVVFVETLTFGFKLLGTRETVAVLVVSKIYCCLND